MYIGQLYVYTWSIDYFISICLPCRSWDNAEVNPMVFRYACHCIAATPVRGLNDLLLDHELRSPLFCIVSRPLSRSDIQSIDHGLSPVGLDVHNLDRCNHMVNTQS